MPIGSVLRSRCGSSYPFLSVRYVLPLLDVRQMSADNVKLRALCAFKANVKNVKERDEAGNKMAAQFDTMVGQVKKDNFPVDVAVGTPMKLMEMVCGQGWDRKEGEK